MLAVSLPLQAIVLDVFSARSSKHPGAKEGHRGHGLLAGISHHSQGRGTSLRIMESRIRGVLCHEEGDGKHEKTSTGWHGNR